MRFIGVTGCCSRVVFGRGGGGSAVAGRSGDPWVVMMGDVGGEDKG